MTDPRFKGATPETLAKALLKPKPKKPKPKKSRRRMDKNCSINTRDALVNAGNDLAAMVYERFFERGLISSRDTVKDGSQRLPEKISRQNPVGTQGNDREMQYDAISK